MDNFNTTVQQKMFKMLSATHDRLSGYAGAMPYGVRKATPKEEQAMFDNLDSGQLAQLIQKHGKDTVNKWLGKHMGNRS